LLGVTFGILGLVWGLHRGVRVAGLLGLWGALGLLLLHLMPGRAPTDVIWVVVPLSFLAGLGVELLVRAWSYSDAALRAAYAALVLVLWAYAYLAAGRFAARGDQADLALVVIAVVVQGLLGLSFGLALGPSATLHTAGAATGIALLGLTLSAAWGVAYGHPADPREVLLSQPTDFGVRDLVQTLRDLSREQTGMPTALEFVLEAPEDSVLVWYLRDFAMVEREDHVGDAGRLPLGAIVVTTDADCAGSAALDAEYVGQDFALQREWTPRALGCQVWQLDCSSALSWAMYRDTPSMPEAAQCVVLWRPLEVAADQ
jgi:hypothetical protein